MAPSRQISKRLFLMSRPRMKYICYDYELPARTPAGVRRSALNLRECPDRLRIAALPYSRMITGTKREHRRVLKPKQLTNLETLLEQTNNTMYAQYANCVMELKKQEKKKRIWTDSDWKKHMEYIAPLAYPRPYFEPTESQQVVTQRKSKPLYELMPRILWLAQVPQMKMHKTLSQDSLYRDPTKVEPAALRYVPTDRIKKLAQPKVYKEVIS